MKAPTKRELNAKMIMYRKLAAERASAIKVATESIAELKKEVISLQAEVFMAAAPASKGNSKYDVTIYGKYGTGSCVIDAYRVIDACSVINPQLQHLVKKLCLLAKEVIKMSDKI